MKGNYFLLAGFCFALFTEVNADELSTTINDQNALDVTIYNDDVALIKDKRQLTLPLGINSLAFKDVSAKIQPETAILAAGDVTLLEQNFEYDLLTPESLLNKFVGKEITLERYENEKLIKEKAHVLANNNGTVLKVNNHIRTNHGLNNIIFENVPADLRDKPTLTMLIDNKEEKKQAVSLSYLTYGLSWKADYVASLRDDKILDLKGWVTLNNNSGTTYKNANLQLVAGEVNRIRHAYDESPVAQKMLARSTKDMATTTMQEESLFEYHLYSLGRKTTIKNNHQKQVSLLEASSVPYRKQILIDARDLYGWRHWNSHEEYQKLNANVNLIIDNKKNSNLGMALPAGVIRTYQKDSQGRAQFVGEDRIKHTPENETIKLFLGQSFDVKAKRKQTDYNYQKETQKTAVSEVKKAVITASYEVVFKNAKSDEVTIDYQENFNNNWEIVEQSLHSEKINSTLNRWKIKIPAKDQVSLKFTVKITLPR